MWSEKARARLEAFVRDRSKPPVQQDVCEAIGAALAEIDRLSKLCCVCDGDCCRLARERKAELDRLVEMAGDWIETDPSLRSTACIEVAISHAREQERELDRQRERAEHLREVGVRQHVRAEQAEACVRTLEEALAQQSVALEQSKGMTEEWRQKCIEAEIDVENEKAEVARLREERAEIDRAALAQAEELHSVKARVRTLEESLGVILDKTRHSKDELLFQIGNIAARAIYFGAADGSHTGPSVNFRDGEAYEYCPDCGEDWPCPTERARAALRGGE